MSAPHGRRTSESFALAMLLAAAAGSIEAYSVIHLGTFAGAQTGNVVLGSVQASQRHWASTARYVWPILAFVCGVLLSRTVLSPPVTALVRRPFRVLLGLELLALVVLGLLPGDVSHVVASVVITVTVAAQASAFRVLVDVGYNSAFTTGNLMNAVTAAHRAIMMHDRDERRHARRALVVISTYAGGAVAGAISTHAAGVHGIWCGAVILALALALFAIHQRLDGQSEPE